MKIHFKDKAIELRRQGLSLQEISRKLGISKSTASLWLRNFPLSISVLGDKRKRNGNILAEIQKEKKKQRGLTALSQAKEEIGEITRRDLFMLGIALYIGEGTKWENLVRIVNSDSRVIRLGVKWLRDICGVDPKNIYLRIHGYPDTDFKAAVEFWSKESGVKQTHFQSHVIDRRQGKSTKRGMLPFGTVHVNVVGDKRGEISLGLKIRKWMQCVLD